MHSEKNVSGKNVEVNFWGGRALQDFGMGSSPLFDTYMHGILKLNVFHLSCDLALSILKETLREDALCE